jgi:hypothetical protein
LHFREANAAAFNLGSHLRSRQHCSLNRRSDGGTNQAIEPMIVAAFRTLLPFLHRSPAAFRFHPVLGRQVLGEEAMLLWIITEKR